MKRVEINKKYLEISLYTLAVILLSFIFGKIIWNIAGFGQSINNFFKLLRGILAPFTFGFFIAYFMNSTMRYLENVIFRRISWFHSRAKLKRRLAVTLTYLVYVGCLFWIFSFLIPQVGDNVSTLLRKLPTDLQYYQNILYKYLGPDSDIAVFMTSFNISLPNSLNFADLMNQILQWIYTSLGSLSNIIYKLLTGTMNFANTVLNFILGLVIAFYMLCDKEHYAEEARKLIVVLFSKRFSDRFIRAASSSNRVIEKFIIGKAIDSLIIAIMFFASTMIIKPPYALLLTLIVGITNMLPYFGPLIGAIVSTLIVLPANPGQAPLVLIVIFVIQQFDGMYLGPKILGDSIGLAPMLVIFAIIVGGAVAGVPGMFFGVPIFAILRNFVKSAIGQRYDQK